jgi:hypothetical protein
MFSSSQKKKNSGTINNISNGVEISLCHKYLPIDPQEKINIICGTVLNN